MGTCSFHPLLGRRRHRAPAAFFMGGWMGTGSFHPIVRSFTDWYSIKTVKSISFDYAECAWNPFLVSWLSILLAAQAGRGCYAADDTIAI